MCSKRSRSEWSFTFHCEYYFSHNLTLGEGFVYPRKTL